jgi:DNA polymerase elongation subunit (family B)
MGKEEQIKNLELLKKKANDLKKEVDYFNALQLALKLVLNGSYGALATPYFILFNNHVAGTITAQGRELTKTMDKVNEDYWYNKWHLDKELHKRACIKNVKQIINGENVSIYADTDSCESDSIIDTEFGRLKIEDWYNLNIKNGSAGNTITGHESVLTNDKILNYSEEKGVYYTPVKRIIRHKVSKAKWKLKTKSGKEIIITNDHSMIVFRDGKKIEVKPSEILKTDKILILKDNIW